MTVLRKDLPEMTKGAQSLRDLILGHQNKIAEAENQSGLDTTKYAANKGVDEAAQGREQDRNVKLARQLQGELGAGNPGHKYNVSASNSGVSFSEAEPNPMLPLARQDRLDKQTQQQAQGYSKRLENINGFNSALQEIEGQTNRDGKGGVLSNPNAQTLSKGGMKTLIPESMTGIAEMIGALPKGATEESKGFQRLANEYMKATSGMRVTPEAAAREKAAMGNVASSDPQLAAKGARALAKMMKERLGQIQGGYPQAARDQVHSMSGDPAAAYQNLYDDNAHEQAPAAGGGSDLIAKAKAELARRQAGKKVK